MYLKSVAVCGIMAALFIGCGGNSDSDDDSESTSTPVSEEEEENKVDSLAVLDELNAEYVTAQLQYKHYINGDVPMPEILNRNVMTIMINRRGEIMTEIAGNWHLCPIESVKNRTIMFLTPCRKAFTRQERVAHNDVATEAVAPEETESPSLPCLMEDGTHPQIADCTVGGIGNVSVSKGIVFLMKDNDETPQATLSNVKDELVDAILEMRDIQSKKYFGCSYFQLTKEERQAVAEMIPMSIFETTPAELYETAPEPPEPDYYDEIDVVSEEEIIAAEAEYYEQFPEKKRKQ